MCKIIHRLNKLISYYYLKFGYDFFNNQLFIFTRMLFVVDKRFMEKNIIGFGENLCPFKRRKPNLTIFFHSNIIKHFILKKQELIKIDISRKQKPTGKMFTEHYPTEI